MPESKELSECVSSQSITKITKFIANEELPGTIIKVREVARGRRQDHKGARGPYSDYKFTIVTHQPLNLDLDIANISIKYLKRMSTR